MKLKAALMVAVLALAACSSGPSDSDVAKAYEREVIQRADQAMTITTGAKFSDLVKVEVKVKNKAKEGDAWRVEMEIRMTPKKDPQQASGMESAIYTRLGMENKDAVVTDTGNARFSKGENGWIVTD